MATDTRQRMIQSAALLFRERGVEGTSFADVVEHAGTPRGSIYHHFPGGKAQLAEEATRHAGDVIDRGLSAVLGDADPLAAIQAFIDQWAEILRASDWQAGCPVVAAALEGDRSPGARDAAGTAFRRWQAALADAFRAQGVPPERATAVATLVVAAVEGAIVLARATRDAAPLQAVAQELRTTVAALLTPSADATA